MGKYNELTIKQVVEELNQSYFLPDIQREYVWLTRPEEKKIEQLFDSLMRGYPIGTFLFWALKKSDISNNTTENTKNGLNFKIYKFIEEYDITSPHNQTKDIEQINSTELNLVLDGQQRLTSLFIGLKGNRRLKKKHARKDNPNAYIKTKLFLNLTHQPNFDDPEDNYEFAFLSEDDLHKDTTKHWFKVGDILTIDSVINYGLKNNLPPAEWETLEKLKNVICTHELISFYKETEKDLDKVLKIFIRINSGGMKLEYSDLLMSILASNFSSDIRNTINNWVDNFQNRGFGCLGRDAILKTCLLLIGSSPKFIIRNFSKRNVALIENNWETIIESIRKAVDLCEDSGYSNQLSSAYIISTIALFFYTKKETNNVDKKYLLHFIQLAQIQSFFTTALDSKLSYISKIINESSSFQEVYQKLANHPVYPLKISSEEIENMKYKYYGSSAVFPILQTLYPQLDYKTSKFHIDHIYPKSKFNSRNKNLPNGYKDKANYLFNLQLLEEVKNRDEKRSKDPEVWLKENYSYSEIEYYKEKNYIPKNLELSWTNIETFKQEREKLLIAKLKELLLNKDFS